MMAGIRGSNTSPEMKVRRLLHRHGFRYRLHQKDCGEASVGDAVSKLHKLLPENEWGGSSVSSPLVAYLDGECNLRSVELHLHPPCQVGLAVSCSLLTARPASSGMGQFDVKAREASG